MVAHFFLIFQTVCRENAEKGQPADCPTALLYHRSNNTVNVCSPVKGRIFGISSYADSKVENRLDMQSPRRMKLRRKHSAERRHITPE